MGRATRIFAATLACSAAIGGLVACGGKSGTGSSANRPTQQQRRVAALNAFARCARARGVPVPDADASGQIPGLDSLRQKYANTPQGQAVVRGCQRELTAAGQLGDEQNAADRRGMLRFARCMRARGIPIPDPSANGTAGGPPQRIDKQAPQVRAAAAICDRLASQRGAGR
jgi:hypothetical protein